MWISQKALGAMQDAVVARDEELAATAREQCAHLREILALLSEDARFQALPVRHAFRPGAHLGSSLAAYGQLSGPVLEWLALSGATSSLLRHEIVLRWMRVHRTNELLCLQKLLGLRVGNAR